MRQFDEEEVSVSGSHSIDVDGFSVVSAPKSVDRFIEKFDDLEYDVKGKKRLKFVKPFSFKLKLKAKE
jgi:hypothetical protein